MGDKLLVVGQTKWTYLLKQGARCTWLMAAAHHIKWEDLDMILTLKYDKLDPKLMEFNLGLRKFSIT